MAQFRMTYPYVRSFEHLGDIEPGQVIEAEVNPDPNFFEAVTAAPTAVAAPVAPAVTEPAAPAPAETAAPAVQENPTNA